MSEKLALGIYRHYKGKDYEVIAVARHSETEEELVVYRLMYGQCSHAAQTQPKVYAVSSVQMHARLCMAKGAAVTLWLHTLLPRYTCVAGPPKFLILDKTCCQK